MTAALNHIAEQRLVNQGLTAAGRRRPAEVVTWLGAVQAQEYAPASWGLALRMQDGAAVDAVERAFSEGRILRTHVMRPTWHFVAPADIRWLLELTAHRVHRVMAPYNRQLGLDTATLTRATGVIERALDDGRHLTRAELGDALQAAGLTLDPIRLAHTAMHAELEGVICSGPRRGGKFTYALVAERAPRAVRLSREEALAELTRRYFRSHGPATARDFAWWSGLTTADARRGLEMNGARSQIVDRRTYWTVGRSPRATRDASALLLPVYDEYLVAYRDREAVPHGPLTMTFGSRTVTFQHAVLVAGQVAGTWRPARDARTPSIQIAPLRRLAAPERRAVSEAAARYARFVGVPHTLSMP
jgi:Winged helix DNA-binding domain